MACRCCRSLANPRGAMCWSIVCESGIFWSYLLTFGLLIIPKCVYTALDFIFVSFGIMGFIVEL